MAKSISTHGRPNEIWSDSGPPYNSHKWTQWLKNREIKAKKTMTYHPPANGMVERFYQGIKRAILAAYVAELDPEDEVVKYVFAYRNTPHSVTGEKPSILLFNQDLEDKLP